MESGCLSIDSSNKSRDRSEFCFFFFYAAASSKVCVPLKSLESLCMGVGVLRGSWRVRLVSWVPTEPLLCVLWGEGGTPAKLLRPRGRPFPFSTVCQNRNPLDGGHALLDVQAPVRDVPASGH